jgi:putative glutamine amidotransferase
MSCTRLDNRNNDQTLQAIDGIPAALPASVVMNQRYYEAVASAGGAPVLIPLLDNGDDLRATCDACDGIMIPGGVDMDPATYGESPHEKLGRIDPARDRVELQLTRWAIEDRKPLLGLCRGLQVINVATGGTLFQDIEAQLEGAIRTTISRRTDSSGSISRTTSPSSPRRGFVHWWTSINCR